MLKLNFMRMRLERKFKKASSNNSTKQKMLIVRVVTKKSVASRRNSSTKWSKKKWNSLNKRLQNNTRSNWIERMKL